MKTSDPRAEDREERLHAVLLAYLEADARGQAPEPSRFLEEHTEFADELADFFTSRQRVESIVAPLRAVAACAGDDCRDRSGGFATPAPSRSLVLPAPHEPVQEAPPAGLLGDFRLVREIGRGGMGIVYEAEQVSLNRRVAVKVLPFAAGLDPKQLQRFRNEAQTAALLNHPNIVPVHAVGCDHGVHYFAMQLVEGRSLAAVIAECRSDGGAGSGLWCRRPACNRTAEKAAPQRIARGGGVDSPSTLPSSRSRSQAALRQARVAELGLRAARALDHAHQQGIVHRDVKPANLLLDDRDRLWITDFGLAIFQTGPGITITGELVGTLRYMSPEQALGRRGLIDHRTDVYSLGATLYELLTLRPVFSEQDGLGLLHQIAYGDPLFPRAVDAAIAVDLETILLKAMAKNPAERYASAGELADDLQRFLEHQPIRARRPTLLDKAAKWARRHRTLVAFGLAAFLLLVGALGFSHYLLHRAHARTKDALAREQLKSQEAEEQRARAEANFRKARQVVDFFVELSDDELSDKPQLLGMRIKLLEEALTYYRDFIDQHGDDPSIQAALEDSRARALRLLQDLSATQDFNKLLLLANQQVQEDLRLTEQQRGRVDEGWKELVTFWEQHAGEARKGKREEYRKLGLALVQRGEEAVNEILTPAQARRLDQISVQGMGPSAFHHPRVIEALGLTPAQQHEIRQRYQTQALHPDDLRQILAPDAKLQELGSKLRDVQQQRMESALEALSAKQRQRWKELTGDPCEGVNLILLRGSQIRLRRQ